MVDPPAVSPEEPNHVGQLRLGGGLLLLASLLLAAAYPDSFLRAFLAPAAVLFASTLLYGRVNDGLDGLVLGVAGIGSVLAFPVALLALPNPVAGVTGLLGVLFTSRAVGRLLRPEPPAPSRSLARFASLGALLAGLAGIGHAAVVPGYSAWEPGAIAIRPAFSSSPLPLVLLLVAATLFATWGFTAASASIGLGIGALLPHLLFVVESSPAAGPLPFVGAIGLFLLGIGGMVVAGVLEVLSRAGVDVEGAIARRASFSEGGSE